MDKRDRALKAIDKVSLFFTAALGFMVLFNEVASLVVSKYPLFSYVNDGVASIVRVVSLFLLGFGLLSCLLHLVTYVAKK